MPLQGLGGLPISQPAPGNRPKYLGPPTPVGVDSPMPLVGGGAGSGGFTGAPPMPFSGMNPGSPLSNAITTMPSPVDSTTMPMNNSSGMDIGGGGMVNGGMGAGMGVGGGNAQGALARRRANFLANGPRQRQIPPQQMQPQPVPQPRPIQPQPGGGFGNNLKDKLGGFSGNLKDRFGG